MTRTRHILVLVAGAALLTLSGCSIFFDLDSVAIPKETVDAATDGGEQDMDTSPVCDVFDDTTCPEGEYCALDITTGDLSCESQIVGAGDRGDTCESDDGCGAGLRCTPWAEPDPRGRSCAEPCELSSGLGCGLGEFCTRTEGEFPGDLGFCTNQCDILEADACGDGQLCVPDPYLPGTSFPPFSRCLINSSDTQVGLGGTCEPLSLNEAGCEAGLTCLTVEFMGSRGSYCLQPCQELADCSNAISYSSCASIEGATNVGYCSP